MESAMKIRNPLIAVCAVSLVVASTHGYAHKDQSKGKPLPPGLYKKQKSGKPLPPGWQKKLAKGDILDNSIYVRGRVVVPVGKDGTVSIEVEGTFIKLNDKTRKILNIYY
jgi:hypothetical protein